MPRWASNFLENVKLLDKLPIEKMFPKKEISLVDDESKILKSCMIIIYKVPCLALDVSYYDDVITFLVPLPKMPKTHHPIHYVNRKFIAARIAGRTPENIYVCDYVKTISSHDVKSNVVSNVKMSYQEKLQLNEFVKEFLPRSTVARREIELYYE